MAQIKEQQNWGPEGRDKYQKYLKRGLGKEEAKLRVQQSISDKRDGLKAAKSKQLAVVQIKSRVPEKVERRLVPAKPAPAPRVVFTPPRSLGASSARSVGGYAQPRKKEYVERQKQLQAWNGRLGSSEGEKKHKIKDRYSGRTPEWWEKLMDTGSDLAKHFAPMLMGMGAYDEDVLAVGPEPEANSIMAGASNGKHGGQLVKELKSGRSDVPTIHEDGMVTRIAHREYIGDVLSSTSAFSALEFPLNPGMKETFPWLNQVAANYTQYQFLGLVFEFVSEGSEYTNSAGLGYVAMSTQYDAGAASYVDKRSMLNAQFADAAKPSKSFQQWVECSPDRVADPRRHVRCAANPSNTSINDYDVGKTTLAVGGNVAGGAVIGEFWVSYDVLLYVPRSQGFVNTTIDKYAVDSAATTSTDAAMLGSGWTATGNSVNTFTPTLTATSITFPNGSRGRYYVELSLNRNSTGTAASGSYNTTLVGCSVVTSNGLSLAPNFVATQPRDLQANVYDVFQDGASITFANTLSFFGGGNGTTKIFITQLPAGYSESAIFDYGGANREANYNRLMSMITNGPASHKKVMLETNVFRVVYEVEASKCWFCTLTEPESLFFIPFEDVMQLMGKPDEFINKFLMTKIFEEASHLSSPM